MQQFESHALAFAQRVLFADVRGESNHALLCLLNCDAGFEQTKRREVVGASIRFPFRSKRQWLPDIDRPPEDRVFESGRHHAYYLHCLSIELDLSSYNVWVASETARPKTIGEDHHVISAGLELFGFEYTATRGRHSQHRKEVGGRSETEKTFRCLSLFSEITAREVVGGHLLEHSILVVLVKEVCCRVRPTLRVRRGAKYPDQSFRLRVGQRAKQKRVQHTEHRCVDADAQCERQHRHDGKTLVLQQHARAIAHVL